jgi:hypothetical protein
MFSEVVENKNTSLIPQIYHPEFELYANQQVQDYAYFKEYHEKISATEIIYQVRYDEHAFVEQAEKLAARVFITINKQGETEKELEIILVSQFKDNKIFLSWELCYPDWSTPPEFQEHTTTEDSFVK